MRVRNYFWASVVFLTLFNFDSWSQVTGQFPASVGLTSGQRGNDVETLQNYLQRFGYLRIDSVREAPGVDPAQGSLPNAASGEFDEATLTALKNYQRFFGLPITGVLDEATIGQMQQPRCGVPDIPPITGIAQYRAQGNRWGRANLTYGFSEFSVDLNPMQTRSAITTAFSLWSQVTNLSFTEVPMAATPDIVIRFVAGNHGDGFPFDGRGGKVLAHAFYPPPNGGDIAGDAHFDEDEMWTFNLPVSAGGTDLVTVAAHEFGHSLGLDHSSVRGALMLPTYLGPQRFLAQDDIEGIRSIYLWGWRPVYAQGDPGYGIGGYDLKSPGDKVFAYDYNSSGKLDHLVLYRPGTGAIRILKHNGGAFQPVYVQGDPGYGIGGYDLKSPADEVFAFDYESSGKMDHLVLYRPGTGAIRILKNYGGTFGIVYMQDDPGYGIGGYDLKSSADKVFAYDYNSSGKLDHLVLYRPGTGAIRILKNTGGTFEIVYVQGDPGYGIGGYDLKSPADQVFAFDYESSGKLDHLVLYRPGAGAISILKNNAGRFHAVYQQNDPGYGIGGYDLRSRADRVLAFDYQGTGKQDHLVLYRPGKGTIWILKNDGGVFRPVYVQGDPGWGIGGYDLKSPADRIFAFDYMSQNRQDHLVLYRPGKGAIYILRKDR